MVGLTSGCVAEGCLVLGPRFHGPDHTRTSGLGTDISCMAICQSPFTHRPFAIQHLHPTNPGISGFCLLDCGLFLNQNWQKRWKRRLLEFSSSSISTTPQRTATTLYICHHSLKGHSSFRKHLDSCTNTHFYLAGKSLICMVICFQAEVAHLDRIKSFSTC